MKETVNVNIGSVAFTIDEDAYRALRLYFDDIRSRLPEGDTETMYDIETRMSEIFSERITSPMRVITLEMVRDARLRMGEPADFGERREANGPAGPATASRRLYRSRRDRSIAGVCGGVAEFFDFDVALVRLLTLLLVLFGGISIWAYILLWIIIPEEPALQFDINRQKR